MKSDRPSKSVFSRPARTLTPEEIKVVSGADGKEPIISKQGGGQDNTGHQGFN